MLVHPNQNLYNSRVISYSIKAAEYRKPNHPLIVQSTVPGIFQFIVCCTETPVRKGKRKKTKRILPALVPGLLFSIFYGTT